MKPNFFILCFLLIVGVHYSNAQKVNFKKEFVLVDGKNCFVFKNDKTSCFYYIYDLETNEEVMYLCYNDNETSSNYDDDYYKVFFSKSGKSLELKSYKEKIVEMAIQNKVITAECKIDEDKIDNFITKYDENITNRTIR